MVQWSVDGSAAGTGSPILDSLVRLSGPSGTSTPAAAATGASNDSVGPLLQLLSTPQIRDLLHSIDAHRSLQEPAVLESLLQTAGAAVAHHDLPRALAVLTQYINRNPEHAAVLPTSPSLLPIQNEVKELLSHMTQDARTGAERLIAAAGLAVDGAAGKHPQGLNGPGVLAVAERFAESGQLVNYVRAAELSQAVITFYAGGTPGIVLGTNSVRAVRRPVLELAGGLWRRVPVLVLLIGWFAVGVAGGAIALTARVANSTVEAGVEFWGVGFLVLVVLQFWISVRGIL
jgi:hypothetical protein